MTRAKGLPMPMKTTGRAPSPRTRTALSALALVAPLAAAPALAQEACSIQPLRFLCDGCTVQRRIVVQRDNGCIERNTIDTVINGVTLTVRPRNGSFGRASASLQAYVPKKGYVGPDYYEFVLSHEIAGRPARTTIQNHVTVQEARPF
jgi:hypothetical protein